MAIPVDIEFAVVGCTSAANFQLSLGDDDFKKSVARLIKSLNDACTTAKMPFQWTGPTENNLDYLVSISNYAEHRLHSLVASLIGPHLDLLVPELTASQHEIMKKQVSHMGHAAESTACERTYMIGSTASGCEPCGNLCHRVDAKVYASCSESPLPPAPLMWITKSNNEIHKFNIVAQYRFNGNHNHG